MMGHTRGESGSHVCTRETPYLVAKVFVRNSVGLAPTLSSTASNTNEQALRHLRPNGLVRYSLASKSTEVVDDVPHGDAVDPGGLRHCREHYSRRWSSTIRLHSYTPGTRGWGQVLSALRQDASDRGCGRAC